MAGDAIRPICEGYLSPDSDEALAAIDRATKCYAAIAAKYKEMIPSPSTGRVGLTPEAFDKFRGFLCSYPVHGKEYTSANAANLQSNFSVDSLSGVSDENYSERIQERLEYLSPDDREIVLADMKLPSVVDVFLLRIGMQKTELLRTDSGATAKRIAQQSAAFQRALASYKLLYRSICALSGKHWGSIKSILINPAEKMSAEEKERMPVSPDRSVGGAGHERPESIFRMRKDNPVVHKLLDACELAVPTNRQQQNAV